MNNPDDFMSSINNWADMYEKACADGVFENAPKPPVPSSQTGQESFFGVRSANPTPEVSGIDADYWDSVYNGESPAAPLEDDGLLNEGASPEKLDKLSDHPSVKRVLSPNPVEPETVGQDQRSKVTPNWTEGKELMELEGLKRSLYDLECKLSGTEGLLESNEKVVKQLDSLKKQIDELSQELIPTGWKDMES